MEAEILTYRGGTTLTKPSWKSGTNLEVITAAFLSGYCASTRRSYKDSLDRWFEWCQLYKLDVLFGVDRPHIELWGRWMEEEKRYAPATVLHRLCTLRSFYRYVEYEGIIEHSPAARIRLPIVSDESPVRGVSRTELASFLAMSERNKVYHALCCLLVLNGLRISEACGINIEHLGVERGHRTITVRRKGGKIQTLPMSPKTARALEASIGERTNGPVMLTVANTRMTRSSAAKAVARLGKQAGIEHKMYPHRCRHAFITLALDAGVPLHDVQDSAGHTDPKTTMRYNRNRFSLDRNATHIVTAFLSGS